jgi:hypothetical protein
VNYEDLLPIFEKLLFEVDYYDSSIEELRLEDICAQIAPFPVLSDSLWWIPVRTTGWQLLREEQSDPRQMMEAQISDFLKTVLEANKEPNVYSKDGKYTTTDIVHAVSRFPTSKLYGILETMYKRKYVGIFEHASLKLKLQKKL